MAKGKGQVDSQFAIVQDADIRCTSAVLEKLSQLNCPESRVRKKLRHFLQYLRELGFTEDWDVLFHNRMSKRLESELAKGHKRSPHEWVSGFRVGGRRDDGAPSGLVFRRSCYRDVDPAPPRETEAKKNGAPVTHVELAFTVKRHTSTCVFTIYRFTEIERDSFPHMTDG